MPPVRIEKFLVQITLAAPHEGSRGTVWKDREKFKQWLDTCAQVWAHQTTSGPSPSVEVSEEN